MVTDIIRDYDIIEGPFNGNYGAVKIGLHRLLKSKKALKCLHPHVDPEIIKEEALKLQQVKSPYVIQIFDFYVEENVIVMEYCPKGLDDILKERFRQVEGGLPYDEARELLHGILQGLNDAHCVGIVHGDIKPANVRFGVAKTEDQLGQPKLGDFGAARRIREETLAIRGSTNWMAPEVIEGEDATKASDYFSFGILAYLVLSGRHPFFAGDPSCLTTEKDTITSSSFRPPPLASLIGHDTPDQVAELVMALLSRDPELRLKAGQALKVLLSEPLERTKVPPLPREFSQPTPEENAQVEEAYNNARELFFVYYSPKDAVEALDTFLRDFQWERFTGQRVGSLADCWSLRAYINNSGGYFEDAITAASNGLEVDDKHVNSLHARGYAYIQLDEYINAENDLLRALQLTIDPLKRRQISQLLDTLKVRQ